MLRWALIFLVLAIVSGLVGFGGGITSAFAGLAQVLFLVFLALLLISLVTGLVNQVDSHDVRD